MKIFLATCAACLFLITSQTAFAFSIKLSTITKQPAVVSGLTQDIETLTLEAPEPLPLLSASITDDALPSELGDSITTASLDPVTASASAVPVPAAAWLLGSGLIGLFSFARRK